MSEVLVIGHRNPDTDAICSAIGYAEFKRRTGMPEAVAARCGDTNERIDFVLNTFGVPAPPDALGPDGPKVGTLQNMDFSTDMETLQSAAGLLNFGLLTKNIDWSGLIEAEVRNQNGRLLSNPVVMTADLLFGVEFEFEEEDPLPNVCMGT